MEKRQGKMKSKTRWSSEIKEFAKGLYVSWPGDEHSAMAACIKGLRRLDDVPSKATLYRWAVKGKWEEERQSRIKASIVDAAAEGLVRKPADIDPNELVGLLTHIIRHELDEGLTDNASLRKVQDRLEQALTADIRPHNLAQLAHAFADTTRAKGKRGSLAARVLQAFATALDALARREEARARADADGHICSALAGAGGAINPRCPLLVADDDDENLS